MPTAFWIIVGIGAFFFLVALISGAHYFATLAHKKRANRAVLLAASALTEDLTSKIEQRRTLLKRMSNQLTRERTLLADEMRRMESERFHIQERIRNADIIELEAMIRGTRGHQ